MKYHFINEEESKVLILYKKLTCKHNARWKNVTKNTYYMISFIWNIQNSQSIKTDRKSVVVYGWEIWWEMPRIANACRISFRGDIVNFSKIFWNSLSWWLHNSVNMQKLLNYMLCELQSNKVVKKKRILIRNWVELTE